MPRAPIPRLLRARGLTLVELMIALTLGLLIILAGSALWLTAQTSYLHQSAAAELTESALYGIEIVTRAVRQSAFVNWDLGTVPLALVDPSPTSISGLDARSLTQNSAGINAPLTAAVNGSDVLALRYTGTGLGLPGDGSMLNCAGFGVGMARTPDQRGWSIFYVASDASGEAELRCKYRTADSSGWGADAIVRGVDTFQVLYGIDTDEPPDGIVNAYVNATALNAIDAALAAAGADLSSLTRWKRVVSIKVALLLHGTPGSGLKRTPAQYDLFGSAYAEGDGINDVGVRISAQKLPSALQGRARRSVVATIFLRNRASGN